MDPQLVNDSSFSGANLPPYSLAEIWQFPVVSAAADGLSGDKALALRMGDFREGTSNRDASAEESTVTEQSGSRGKRRDATACEDESSKLVSTCSGADMNISIPKRFEMGGSRDENDGTRIEAGISSRGGKNPLEESKSSEPPKQDYIHVRARRGQATDSHSLAERARREKISERMKILQDLVPGCNKVIGKALVLDEIINYIQSLQRQVEFLSMKLEAVNTGMNPTIEGFTPKELGAQTFDAPGMIYGSHTTREYAQESSQLEWLHMQLGGNFGRAT